jgi:hypothetical protein
MMTLTDRERRILHAVWPVLEPRLSLIVEEFGREVRRDRRFAALISDDMSRLGAEQAGRWRRLLTATHEAGRRQAARRAGIRHVERRIPSDLYARSCMTMLSLLVGEIVRSPEIGRDDVPVIVTAMIKLARQDMCDALETYSGGLV